MIRTRLATAAVAALFLAASPALAQMDHSAGHGAAKAETGMSAASQAYMTAMEDMNTAMEAMEMTGEPGVDFALMMIPHHQSAIDMAKAYLDSGAGDPELTKLSEEIIAAQESEIAFLTQWIEKNRK